MKINWKRSGLLYILILLTLVVVTAMFYPSHAGPTEVPVSKLITMSNNNQITKMVEDGEWLTATTTDKTEIKVNIGVLNYSDLVQLGLNKTIEYDIARQGVNWGNILLTFLPLLLLGALLFFFFFRARGASNQALSFGRSRARLAPMDKPSVSFADVAGVDEAKQELTEVVEFLKSREKFQGLGARIPRGVLLIGPPGTGKTLLARAVAGEAGVPFFSISGSEFVEMFVGVGASRVRDLFEQAKRHSPCIIFVDEIDAVGRQRGAGLGGSHDEREQTLNQILTEMDGFDTDTSIIVLAATNRPDILDPALLRPGRFDRRVVLDRPDIAGRMAILKVHIKDKPLDKGVDMEVLAKQTAGFSGADLANLINEAAILAARRGRKDISMLEFEASVDKVIAGPERKSKIISPKEKEITAYHEAGHALVGYILPNIEPLRKITIIPHGMAGGFTRFLEEDHSLHTYSYLKDMVATFLAGHTAEQLTFHEVTTGASDDIKRATNMARKMVTDLGMSKRLGSRTFGDKQEMVFLGREISEQRDYGDKIADIIDEEIDSIISEARDTATTILTKNKAKLKAIAEKLIADETIEGDEISALFDDPHKKPQKPVKPKKDEPVPIEGAVVVEKPKRSQRKKPQIIPNPLPNQAPAGSD